jgi:hypothetical protein
MTTPVCACPSEFRFFGKHPLLNELGLESSEEPLPVPGFHNILALSMSASDFHEESVNLQA